MAGARTHGCRVLEAVGRLGGEPLVNDCGEPFGHVGAKVANFPDRFVKHDPEAFPLMVRKVENALSGEQPVE